MHGYTKNSRDALLFQKTNNNARYLINVPSYLDACAWHRTQGARTTGDTSLVGLLQTNRELDVPGMDTIWEEHSEAIYLASC